MKKLLYLFAIVLLASCHSSKKAQKTDVTDVTNPTTTTTPVATNKDNTTTAQTKPNKKLTATEKLLLNVDSTTFVNYTAKIKVNLKMNSKSVSTNGSLRMRWNDVIQISLVDPVLGIAEVGRLEFSKNNVLIVDRINKQYVQESYESLSALAKSEITYEYIQALFWSETQKKDNKKVTYKVPLKNPVTLNLELSSVGHKDSWDAHYVISNKYKKVSAEELFKSLSSL